MALPPPWIALYEAMAPMLDPQSDEATNKRFAADIVDALEAQGLQIVPNYAVNELALHVTLGVHRA